MAAPFKASTESDQLSTEIVGSNSAMGMDVCRRSSVFWCPVEMDALQWADIPRNGVHFYSNRLFIIKCE
jgi:hypothetical protein